MLKEKEINSFIGTVEYNEHKRKRFRQEDDPNITLNEAFRLQDRETRSQYEKQYNMSKSLYYKEKPSFTEILEMIQKYSSIL